MANRQKTEEGMDQVCRGLSGRRGQLKEKSNRQGKGQSPNSTEGPALITNAWPAGKLTYCKDGKSPLSHMGFGK